MASPIDWNLVHYTSTQATSEINILPSEIHQAIFSFMEVRDVPCIALVCKDFNVKINDAALWKIFAWKTGLQALDESLHPKKEVEAFYEIKKTNHPLYWKVASILMSPTAFIQLPILNIDAASSVSIDSEEEIDKEEILDPDTLYMTPVKELPEMTSTIMKGVNKANRAFIVVCFLNKREKAPQPFVMVITDRIFSPALPESVLLELLKNAIHRDPTAVTDQEGKSNAFAFFHPFSPNRLDLNI